MKTGTVVFVELEVLATGTALFVVPLLCRTTVFAMSTRTPVHDGGGALVSFVNTTWVRLLFMECLP